MLAKSNPFCQHQKDGFCWPLETHFEPTLLTSLTLRRKNIIYHWIRMVCSATCHTFTFSHISCLVTFLKVCIDAIDSTWQVGHAALQFNAPRGLRIESNDLAGKLHRKVTSIRLRPSSVKLLVASRPSHPAWLEAAQAEISVCLDLYDAPAGWRVDAKTQADFIAREDAPTGRARSLTAMHGLTEKFEMPPGNYFTDVCST